MYTQQVFSYLARFFYVFIVVSTGQLCGKPKTGYVDPFIGTSGGGNTFPGAIVPWGMVSVSPCNDIKNPAGYSAKGGLLRGFGHVHLSGVGCPDLGNVLIMPTTGDVKVLLEEIQSPYKNEKAKPGYYAVELIRYNIKAEMSVTTRAGISRYFFPKRKGDANIFIDAGHSLSQGQGSYIKIISPTEVEGFSKSGGFCGSGRNAQTVYFYVKFSKPSESQGTFSDNEMHTDSIFYGTRVGAYFRFSTRENEPVLVKVGISYVSTANAKLNLETEIPDFDFNKVKHNAEREWNEALERIEVTGGSFNEKRAFYTGLYHIMIHPNVINDVNGEYPLAEGAGIGNVYKKGYTRYSVYSLWDTYRTVHPFLALVFPEKQLDMVKTMIEQSMERGFLPKWELAGYETYVMVGDPATIVIVDTYLKGITSFDITIAYHAISRSARGLWNPLRPGLKAFLEYGYIPLDEKEEWVWGPVSTTLEYCYADWAIAQLAKVLGKNEDAHEFYKRSMSYKNLFDSTTGFLRPKMKDGSWYSPFDPYLGEGDKSWPGSGGPGYCEGNAWQYTFFVPHDIPGLIELMGGEKQFLKKLQTTFDEGTFSIENEPDIAYPYLFNYVPHEEWRTQKTVRTVMEKYLLEPPLGIPGNDDTGTLSAWYVFSAMGFYPDLPASDFYQIGSPLFDKIVFVLNNTFYPGKKFVIETKKNSTKNIYIQSMVLNGKKYTSYQLKHSDIVKGGKLVITMGNKPLK